MHPEGKKKIALTIKTNSIQIPGVSVCRKVFKENLFPLFYLGYFPPGGPIKELIDFPILKYSVNCTGCFKGQMPCTPAYPSDWINTGSNGRMWSDQDKVAAFR